MPEKCLRTFGANKNQLFHTNFNAMKTEKKQLCNRMGAAILLLALACVNGYAQEENKSSNTSKVY